MYKKAFTLIELLVVIAIIGILATIVLANVLPARAKGRDAKRIADIKTIQLALEEYYNDNGSYPTGITSGQLNNYLTTMPLDPTTGASYFFDSWDSASAHGGNSYVCTGSNIPVGYHLGAMLENPTNTYSGITQADEDYRYQICGNSGTLDFYGKSTNCGNSLGITDYCYDVTN